MSDSDLNEVVAFALAEERGITLSAWQDDIETRNEYRAKAKSLIDSLHDAGVRMAVSRSKVMAKRLVHIRTWQPRVAYDLASEVQEDAPATGDEETQTETTTS